MIIKYLAAAVATLALLAACDNYSGQEKIKPTRADKTFTMTVEVVPEKEMESHCSQLGVTYDANGCAAFNLDTKHCTIYVMEPRHVDDTERFAIIGHETWHCMNGRWHD